LDDEPKAGLIDDRMRLQIKSSRFLLADLTHGNKGAYWEAGYAEGLGKPVIYLCKQAVFDDESSRPHFDTNHHLTITWDISKPDDFASRLKATIRFSIPEAQQVD
jgi:nucleoside 2-deoxyribosyltransferase